MVGIADYDKSPATAKNMALELLGWMGSAISDLTAAAQHLIPGMDDSESDLTEYLRQLFDDHSRRALHPQDLVVSDGPYRITLEYLQDRDLDSSQLASARGYYLAQWAKTVCSIHYKPEEKDDFVEDAITDNLARILTKTLSDPTYLDTNRYVSFRSHGGEDLTFPLVNSTTCQRLMHGLHTS
jgi:cohesin loading factor subunit SCC2